MSPRRTMSSGIVLALLVGLVLALVQSPASAQGYDISTVGGAAPSDGSARSYGDVSFSNRYTFTISGRINDRCPGDGYGAYLRVIGAYGNGQSISSEPIPVASDTHTCGASADGYPFTRTISRDSSRTIAWVRLTLFEINADNGAYGDTASTGYFYNPRA